MASLDKITLSINKLPDIKASEFDTTFRINVLAPLVLVQAVQPYLSVNLT